MADLSKRKRDKCGKLLPSDGTEEIPLEKKCTRCRIVKTLDDFPPDSRRIDGRMSRCRACCAETAAAHRRDDLEGARAYDRSERRRSRRNERLRERRASDPEYAARIDAIREIRRQLARSGITTDALYERDGGLCHICERAVRREDAEPDHVIPLSRGGSNDATNVKLAHVSCNRRKSDKIAP
jgi:5-methylcytosine-specific restriction endonuclease McrA